MTTTAEAPSSRARDPRAALQGAVDAMTARRRAEVEVLQAALVWAHAHTVEDPDDAAGWRTDTIHRPGTAGALFGEQAIPLAGVGTPLVAEFAPAELAAALDVSHEAALALLGDVLDLAHRLPRLWVLVGELRVPVHLARRAAQESRDLSVEAADHADRLLVWRPRRLNPHRVGVLVHEARLYADPDRAVADHDAALASRRVDVDHHKGAPGCSQVWMTLDTSDAIAFDATVSTMAATMGALGHPGDLDVRRANAVGILADPQRALDLLAVDPSDPDRPDPETDPETDPAVCAAEDAMYAGPNPFARPGGHGGQAQPAGEAVLVLHVTDRDLLAGGLVPGKGGVARSDQLGPLLLARLRAWLFSAAEVTIRPVLDLDAMSPVDAHDPPAPMAEAVRWRDETCVFPHCNRPSVRCDLDHIDAYVDTDDGGPRARRVRTTWPRCVGVTTAPRHMRPSTIADSPTGPTGGRCPPGSRSLPTHPPRDPDPDRPASPTPPR